MRDLKLIFAASFLLLCNCVQAQQATPDAGAGAPSTQAKPQQPTTPAQKPADANSAGAASDQTVKKPAPKKKVTQKPAPKPAAATTTTAPTPAATPAPDPATAKEKEELEHLRSTTLSLIKLLVQEGILTQDKADQLVRDAERAAITPATVVQREPAPSTAAGAAAGVAAGAAAGAATAAAATTSEATAGAAQAPSGAGVKAATADAAQTPAPGAKVQRIPYVPEVVRNEIREQVREDVIAQAKAEGWATPNAVPEWVDRISFDGDLRLRYQANRYGADNVSALTYNAFTGSNQANTSENEDWFRVRARLGLTARITDSLTTRISISTGNAQNPVSLNQNWANYFSGFSVQLDNAYVRYAPSEKFDATAGRMPKPFYSSEMVWWDDLVFDGVAATGRTKLGERANGFVTGGAFLIQAQNSNPITPDPKIKSLLGLQLGGDTLFDRYTKLKLALAYYYYRNTQGIPNTLSAQNANDWTVPGYLQKGNSLFDINAGTGNPALYALASNFHELNLTGALDLTHFDPYLVRISGDYVNNLGFNQAQIQALTGLTIPKRTSGYQAQLLVGKLDIKELNDWQAFVMYRYLPGDATFDAFNDPDFHLGGTNAKGYTLGLTYGLAKNTWMRARWMSADEIDGPPLAIDVFQLDFNVRF